MAPNTISLSARAMSSSVAMPLFFHVPHAPVSRNMLPIQASFSGSNWAPALPNSGSSATGALNTPSAVPSFGATLAT